jgi:hypothetical protein
MMWGEEELSSEEVGEEKEKGRAQTLCAENENAGHKS